MAARSAARGLSGSGRVAVASKIDSSCVAANVVFVNEVGSDDLAVILCCLGVNNETRIKEGFPYVGIGQDEVNRDR